MSSAEVKEKEKKGKSPVDVARGLLGAVGGRIRSAAARGIQIGADILLGEESDEFEPEDPKVEFENACKVANEYLTTIAIEYGLPEDEISATHQQLQKKEVTISTHGRHSCGKSTLLNALLDDSLLPTCLENNTGVRVTIKHSGSVHRGMCPNPTLCERCPRLEMTWTGARGHTQIVHGAGEVRKTLEERNNISRKFTSEVDKVDSQATECILTTSFPTLSGVERGWELSILDNPGYGEADQEGMMQETETTMKTSSALLYVMDVGQLQDSEDARRLKQLYTADKGIFADSNRLTVAVTQFDKTYNESREWSKEEIQRKVGAFIEHQTGSIVQPEAVIPVCGKWAFDARQLKKCPDDRALLRRVRAGLVLCPSAPGGESMSQEEPPEVLAERLLSVTGIEVLENRIHTMASVCVRTWVSSLSQKYHNYLEMVVKRLDISIKDTSAELMCFKKSHCTVVRHFEELRAMADNLEDKTVLGELRTCCEKDVLAAKTSAENVLEDFHEQCRREIEAKKKDFGPKEYECKIVELLRDKFSEKLCATVFDASRGFNHGWKVRIEATKKMKRAVQRMKKAAEKLLALSGERPTDDEDHSEEEFSASELESDSLEDVFKGKKLTFENFKDRVKIPKLDLSWGKWFNNGFWWSVSFLRISSPPVYTYSSADCVAETMEQTESYVEETLCRYLQGLEQSVAESFFNNYCKITKSNLRSFEEKYKNRVEEKKKKGDEHSLELSTRLELLKEERARVQQFQRRLKRASQEYNKVLCTNDYDIV